MMIPQLNVALMLVCLSAFAPMPRRGLVMAKQVSHRRTLPWLIGVGSILAASCTPASLAQILVDLTIDGPSTVVENTETQYCATAHFDDGSEFDVTIFCDWSVKPDTYASIDTFGRLTTLEVSEDRAIVVWASFTWRDVTLDASIDVTIIDVTKDPEGDPWPEHQRTASRLGRTSTIGPQTPTISWSIQFDFSEFPSALGGSTTMDAEGRLFVPQHLGITCVDSISRDILWEFNIADNVDDTPSLYNGRLLFGSPNDTFYCIDAVTGEEIWSVPAFPHPNHGQVVDDSLPGGVVYYGSGTPATLYARRVEDGAEVWTIATTDLLTAPSLDGFGRLFIGGVASVARAHATADGQTIWPGPGGWNNGVAVPVENGRVYAANFGSPGPLSCLDAASGDVIWIYKGLGTNSSPIALGHDGTVYIAEADLIAISPDGEELWRYPMGGLVKYPPIVDGGGTIYVSTFNLEAGALGEVHAVNPDGTGLWVKEMPDQTQPSPMLAPDGTLYIICKDKYLYAFKDPDVLGDLDGSGVVGAADLLALLASWGKCPDLPETCPADLDLDGTVGAADLLILLANWG